MQTYYVAKGSNPHYLFNISCPGHGVEIVADMPEEFQTGITSEWESRLPYNLADMVSRLPIGQSIGSIVQGLSGFNAVYQDTSWQMWMGTSPIEIPVTLLFDAETSALNDVHRPLAALEMMALPNNTGGGWLTAPGPKRGGTAGDYSVHIRVGRMLTLVDCILVSVNCTRVGRVDGSGFPMAGQAEITIRTGMVYGSTDWLNAVLKAA